MKSIHAEETFDMTLKSQDHDWKPTPHGEFLAQVLAESEFVRGKRVLELGGGVGNHSILILRQEPAEFVTTEVSADRLATTRENIEANCEVRCPIEYRVADWLQTEGEFDVLISNPPFAQSGKRNRRYYIDSLILDAHKRLVPGGSLIFIQSSMADLPKTLSRLEENRFDARIVSQRRGPFRDYYFEDEEFMEEIKHVEGGFEIEDGTYYETLTVIEARLQEFQPLGPAH